MIITVDPNDIQILATEGEKFIFKPSAEEKLVQLLKLQKTIDEAVEQIKVGIAEAGKSINPNFKGVIGDEVRCIYRAYGGKYKYDYAKIADAKPFLKEKTSFAVDSDLVEKYIREVGELPDGILEADRENKLSITYKENEPERQLLE